MVKIDFHKFHKQTIFRFINKLLDYAYDKHSNNIAIPYAQFMYKQLINFSYLNDKYEDVTPDAKRKILKSKTDQILVAKYKGDYEKTIQDNRAKVVYDLSSFLNDQVFGWDGEQIYLNDSDVFAVIKSKKKNTYILFFEIES